jgi:hypothetical protein
VALLCERVLRLRNVEGFSSQVPQAQAVVLDPDSLNLEFAVC